MKKSHLILGAVLSFVLAGCNYTPPPKHSDIYLNDEAKSVLLSEGTMVNCRVLGQVEGKDERYQGEYPPAIYTQLDENAKNDLRNNASVYNKQDRLISVRILDKEIHCFDTRLGWTNCSSAYMKAYPNSEVKYVKYKGEILDCGER